MAAYSKANGYTADFDHLPTEIQLALFDMIFNLGATKLRTVYLNFNAALKRGRWDQAAAECNRFDVNAARNNYVKNLLMTAYNNSQLVTP